MKQYKAILRKNLGAVAGVGALNILTSLSMVYAGYSLSYFFTAYEHGGDKVKALAITFAIELAIWLGAMGICYLTWLSQAKLQRKLKNDLRAMIGGRIASLNYGEFTARDCGHYVSWLTNDVEQIYSQSFSSLFSGIENLASAVFSLGALWLLSPYIGVAAIVLLVVISVLPQMTAGKLRKANAARSEAMEVSTERYKDAVMGGSVLFLANLPQRICQRITDASQKAEEAGYRYNRTNATVQTLISSVSLVGQVVLLFVSLLAAVMGATPAGAALSVGNLGGSFFNGAGELVQAFLTVKASKPLWEKFQYEETVEKGAQIPEIPAIKLEDVSFRYGDRPVLEHQSFTFRPGGKYAIMGESGSGKSTLAKLLLGLLPGYEGAIRYGEVEQRDISLASLYRTLAYVDQQVYLFQDTLRFNITLGQPYTDDEIRAAVRKCRLEEFVSSLPHGLDTVIQENGKNLSGGQRQRIALARGLIREVGTIILDEGTSALDEANALDIESALLEDPDLGVILITHNLRDSVREKLTAVYALT